MHPIRAKKGLGQHFLNDKNIAAKIVGSIIPGDERTIIEVGPGTGILTRYLIEAYPEKFLSVELDKESVDYLKNQFSEHNQKIIYGDFLKFQLGEIDDPIVIIGNFPYFISSQIFFKVLENYTKISQVICMIQKEVAERIAAPAGSRTYGILSVLLQAYFKIEYLFTVGEKCFTPPPKVKSAVIRLRRNNTSSLDCDPVLFVNVVKTGFNQRRKVLSNSLQRLNLSLPLGHEFMLKRPEQLTVNQFVDLTNLISEINQK